MKKKDFKGIKPDILASLKIYRNTLFGKYVQNYPIIVYFNVIL